MRGALIQDIDKMKGMLLGSMITLTAMMDKLQQAVYETMDV